MASKYQRKQSDTSLTHHYIISFLIKGSLRIQYPQLKWEDFNEYTYINSLLDIPTILEENEIQDEPQFELEEENPHNSLVDSPPNRQGENEGHEELEFRPPLTKELHSSSKLQKSKRQRGSASNSSIPYKLEGKRDNLKNREEDPNQKEEDAPKRKKESVKKGKKKIKVEVLTPRCSGRLREQGVETEKMGESKRKGMSKEQPQGEQH